MGLFSKLAAIFAYGKQELVAALPALQQKWPRPSEPGDLTEDQAVFLRTQCKCPYCHSPIFEGPSGGLSTNVFCGNPDCNSRFNVILIPFVSFAGQSAETPAWGEFTGTCPEDFLAARRTQIAQETTDA